MKKSIDAGVFIVLAFTAEYIWYFFALKPLWGMMFFTMLPVAYLHIRKSLPWSKILPASITLGILLGIFFDFIQSFNTAWIVDRLVIPWKIFGVLPVDNVLGYFVMTICVISFYEYFFESETEIPAQRFVTVTSVVLAVCALVLLCASVVPHVLAVPYSYLSGGIAAATLTIVALYRRPQFLDPCLRISAYFFSIWLGAELAALHTDGWVFAGDYIGWVTITGVTFPFEEFIFWMFWYAPFLILAYEYLLRRKDSQRFII